MQDSQGRSCFAGATMTNCASIGNLSHGRRNNSDEYCYSFPRCHGLELLAAGRAPHSSSEDVAFGRRYFRFGQCPAAAFSQIGLRLRRAFSSSSNVTVLITTRMISSSNFNPNPEVREWFSSSSSFSFSMQWASAQRKSPIFLQLFCSISLMLRHDDFRGRGRRRARGRLLNFGV
jgi:hypothetical protein